MGRGEIGAAALVRQGGLTHASHRPRASIGTSPATEDPEAGAPWADEGRGRRSEGGGARFEAVAAEEGDGETMRGQGAGRW